MEWWVGSLGKDLSRFYNVNEVFFERIWIKNEFIFSGMICLYKCLIY